MIFPRIKKKIKRYFRPEDRKFLRQIQNQWMLLRNARKPAPIGKEPTLIYSTMRTGSTLLTSLLNSHPEIRCLGEVLNPVVHIGIPFDRHDARDSLRHIDQSLSDPSGKACGIKLPLLQLRQAGLTPEDLHRRYPQARIIVIYRENLLAQYTSLVIVSALGRWHTSHPKKIFNDRIFISRESAVEFASSIKQIYRNLHSYPWIVSRALWLSYEELSQDPNQCFKTRIGPHLELRPHPLKSHLKKQNPRPLEESIANYEDVIDIVAQGDIFNLKLPHL